MEGEHGTRRRSSHDRGKVRKRAEKRRGEMCASRGIIIMQEA